MRYIVSHGRVRFGTPSQCLSLGTRLEQPSPLFELGLTRLMSIQSKGEVASVSKDRCVEVV